MNMLRKILGLLMAALVLAFAIMNRQDITLIWSPLHDPLQTPLYLIVLGAMALGVVIGGMAAWFGGGKVRREKRHQKKQIKALQKELETVQTHPVDDPASDLFPVLPPQITKY